MTESQLPAAAAAQKFGTLIPNRIFGESRRATRFPLLFLAFVSNCIMSFPYNLQIRPPIRSLAATVRHHGPVGGIR